MPSDNTYTIPQNNETYTLNSMAHKNQRTVPFGAKLMKNNKQISGKQRKKTNQTKAISSFAEPEYIQYIEDMACEFVLHVWL